jgi:glutamate-ammonia-ligase adenylyltransferase
MREFDLASDADLVFVLPDEDHEEHVFWTRVAERIDRLDHRVYRFDGVMFTVDTRLRPNGSAGALLQLGSGLIKRVFRQAAPKTWEGIAYMKVACRGGRYLERATDVSAHELQKVDWRRYGQSGRSQKGPSRRCALRLEKEQGVGTSAESRLHGGFYDIDFSL